MSNKAFATVLKSFDREATRCFGFLQSDFNMAGPERESRVMPTVAFVGSGLRYSISLDIDDKAIVTTVQISLETSRLVSELDKLVVARGLGSRNQVSRSARTLREMKRSLELQAEFVRQLHALLASADAEGFMRKAHAREWH